jgi:hypothetical protein
MDTLPSKDRMEIDKKIHIKSLLGHNYHKCSNNMSKTNKLFSHKYKNGNINVNDIIEKIKTKCANSNYQFNLPNLPVTTRYPSSWIDKRYLEFIRLDINKWNEMLFGSSRRNYLRLKELHPIMIMETEYDFIIVVIAKIWYSKLMIYLELRYYGKIEESDDFTNDDDYYIQLIDIETLSKSDYKKYIRNINDKTYYPFMTMKEQMAYVDRINRIHRNEANEY